MKLEEKYYFLFFSNNKVFNARDILPKGIVREWNQK